MGRSRKLNSLKGDYAKLVGSRSEVWHKTAYKTTGGLTKSKLMQNKSGRIVSVKKYNTAKREKRLAKAGYIPKKGVFTLFRKHNKNSNSKSKSKRNKTRRNKK